MKHKKTGMKRRQFLSSMGAVTVGSLIPFSQACNTKDSSKSKEASETDKSVFPTIPRRTLGKTGVDLPVIALGSGGDLREKQAMLATCLQYGLNYWDTSIKYSDGNSEMGMGKYFSNHPDAREKVFLVTKADDIWANLPDIGVIIEQFSTSLQHLNMDFVDGYVGLHAMEAPETQLNNDLKEWALSMKKQGKFKYFGVSTHKNMPQVLSAISKLDWIDFALTKYDFELMYDEEMHKAIEACYQAGIGLIAIKTQRNLSLKGDLEIKAQKELAQHFLEKGFTEGQAKLKMVLEDKRITAASVGMGDIGILVQNIAAVLDKTLLTRADKEVLRNYASKTCQASCKGCAHICGAALPDMPYVSDIMRQLVYFDGHGDHHKARQSFAQIPIRFRKKLLTTDFSIAESRCPQNIPIGKFIAEAVRLLS
jgi:predicted aldo/keto reductase-like oxidoreductase